MKHILNTLAPPAGFRRKLIKKLLQVFHLRNYKLAGYYDAWVQQQRQNLPLRPLAEMPKGGPLISIVVPAYNTPKTIFYELIYSIVSQAYTNWELIVVNASDNRACKRSINRCTDIDDRIRVVETDNGGISDNTNKGIKAANGGYIAFVDHDDTLDPFALYEIAKAIRKHDAGLIYSDEDKISEDGVTYFDPHFKPDWSPDLLTHVNYITHLVAIKKSLLDKVGLLDPAKDGAQDYDLLLRIIDAEPVIHHIPKVLYHWRASNSSTAQDFSSKHNVTNAGVQALQAHFKRQKTDVKVTSKPNRPGFYTIRPKPYESVSLIITPFASDALLRLYTELLLLKTDLSSTQLELIVPPGVAPRTKIKKILAKELPATAYFLKEAVSSASHEQIIVINQVVLPTKQEWLEGFNGLLKLKHIIAASPLIVRHNSTIEDCGLVRLSEGELWPLFRGQSYLNNQTFFGNTDWVRDVDALTGSFILVRKKELRAFLEQSEPTMAPGEQLANFTIKRPPNKFNVVFSDTLFDNHSIRLQPQAGPVSMFNPNLFNISGNFEVYTPEASAISVLMHLKEVEEGKVL